MKKRSRTEYLLFAEAWILLAFARAVLILFPFKKIAPLLGKVMYEVPQEALGRGTAIQQPVGLAIARACRFSPWRTKCFEQAIAAKLMLKRRGVKTTVFFGVLKDASQKIHAHAWLKSNEMIVTGGPYVSQFTIVSWFGS